MRGNNSLRALAILSVVTAILGLGAGRANAVVIFSEDFESPVVSGYSQGTLPDDGYWIGASVGYHSNYWGLVNEDTGTFTDPVGAQAMAFRYTNSGVTTADGVIGSFEAGMTYTISFDAVMDGYNNGTAYTVKLYAIPDGASRTDCRNNNGLTLLETANGNAAGDGSYTHVTFDFTADPVTYAGIIGQDIGIRLVGATSKANIDNVQVSIPAGAYWDLNGTAAGCGSATPSGTWNATNAYFNPVADGTSTPVAWTPGQTATFSAGDDANGVYTVTVDGTQDIGGLRLFNGDVTLTPGTAGEFRMTADSTVYVDANRTMTVTTAIGEDVAGRQLTKNGDGTLVLSGANTFTGGLAVSGGSVDLGGTSQAVGPVTVSQAAPSGDTLSNGTLTATSYAATNTTGAAVISANLQGSGATMTKTGAGVAVLSGTNTYDGMTSISAGALVLAKQAAINGGISSITPTNVTVESGAALGLGVGDSAGGYFDAAAVATVLSQMSTSTATTGMKPGAQLGLDTTNATGGTFTYSNVIGDLTDGNSLGLAKLGPGQLILDAANTYTGATTVYAGTLTAGAGQTGAFGATPSLAFGPDSAATVQLNGNDISVSSLTSNGGTPVVENGAATNAALTVNNSANITYAGTFQDGTGGGSLKLVKDGGGTLSLGAGANTYTGGTDINGGAIANVNVGSLGTGDITATGDGGLQPAYGQYPVIDNNIIVNPGVTFDIRSANQYYAFGTNGTLSGDDTTTLRVGPNTSNGASNKGFTAAFLNAGNTFTGTIDSKALLRVNSLPDSNSPIILEPVAGNRSAGLELYSGTAQSLNFVKRQLQLKALGTVVLKNSNETASNTITINDLVVNTGTSALKLDLAGSNTGDNTIASNIADGNSSALSVQKDNGGTWILAGTNSYTGTTTLNGGALGISASNNLGDGSATNTLIFNGGGLRILGTGLTQMSDLTNSGTRGITYTSGKTVGLDIADPDNTFTVDQVLNQGSGGLTKDGAGTAVLNQVNTYTGNTTVNAGTLGVTGSIDSSAVTVNADAAITGGGSAKTLTIKSGGILDWGYDSSGDSTLDLAGNLTLNSGWILKLTSVSGSPVANQQYDLLTYVGNYNGSAVTTPITLVEGTDFTVDTSAMPSNWDISGLEVVVDSSVVYVTGVSGALIGDANGDGVVDAADYIILKQNIGTASGATVAQGDFNSDGAVNWADLKLLMASMGNSAAGASTIPEPASAMLLMFGAGWLLKRRRN